MESSNHRHATMNSFPHPATKEDVITILGDQSDKEYPIFRESGVDDYVKTVAVGKITNILPAFVVMAFYILISTNMSILAKVLVLHLHFFEILI
jgi:hypothetical protein